jgi:hypothetical protein
MNVECVIRFHFNVDITCDIFEEREYINFILLFSEYVRCNPFSGIEKGTKNLFAQYSRTTSKMLQSSLSFSKCRTTI